MWFATNIFCCLVRRRLSLDENVRAKEGGKETSAPFPWFLAVHHQSFASTINRLYLAKNEAPEEEAAYSASFRSYIWELLNNPRLLEVDVLSYLTVVFPTFRANLVNKCKGT